MIQHVVGNDDVKGLICIWDGLGIDLLKFEIPASHNQITPRCIQHA